MKILLLGPYSELFDYLSDYGLVINTDEKLTVESASNCDWLVSYRYRHILKKPILDLFPDRAVNLHTSFLPWNRGADPNFWAIVKDTPHGVTIHHIDEGIDTGDIIAQTQIHFSPNHTLQTSYDSLQRAVIDLFKVTWPKLLAGTSERRPQEKLHGSCHKSKDKLKAIFLMKQGWDTTIFDIQNHEQKFDFLF